jgi:hypothetical protein
LKHHERGILDSMNVYFIDAFVQALKGTELDNFCHSAFQAQNLALVLNEAKHAPWIISPEEQERLEKTEKKVTQLLEGFYTYSIMSKRCLELIVPKVKQPSFKSGLRKTEIADLESKLKVMEMMPKMANTLSGLRKKQLQLMNTLAMEITAELNSFFIDKSVEDYVQLHMAHARTTGSELSPFEINKLRAEARDRFKADDTSAPMGSIVHQIAHDAQTTPAEKPESGTFPYLDALGDKVTTRINELTEPTHDQSYVMAMGRYVGAAAARDGSNLFDEIKIMADASDHRDYAYAHGAMNLMFNCALHAHMIQEKINTMVFNPPAPPPPGKTPKK